MKKLIIFCLAAGTAVAAISPVPITIDARESKAPKTFCYRANARTYRFTVQDGATNMNLSGMTVKGYWFKTINATNVIQGTATKVNSGTNGQVDVAFAAADLNHGKGNYIYGVTITENGSTVTINQGPFEIRPSPPVTGVSTTSFGETMNFAVFTNFQNTATSGPYRAGTNITLSANSDGSVNINSAETNLVNVIAAGTAIDITTNGTTRTINVDGTESFNASGATNLNGSNIASGTVADARIASTIARDSELTQVLAGTAIDITTNGVNRTINVDGTETFNASGATNLNGTEIKSGTVADARIASTIARDSELTQVLASGTVGVTTSGVNRTVFYKGSAISNVVEDTSPQLGADLDGQATYDISNTVHGTFSGTVQAEQLTSTDDITATGQGSFATDSCLIGYQSGDAVFASGAPDIIFAENGQSDWRVQADSATLTFGIGNYPGATYTSRFEIANGGVAITGNATVSSGEIRTTAADAGAADIQGRNGVFTNVLGVRTIASEPLHVKADSGTETIRLEENSGTEHWDFLINSSGWLIFEDDNNHEHFIFDKDAGTFKATGSITSGNDIVSQDDVIALDDITCASGEIRTTAADAGSYDGQFRDLTATNTTLLNGNASTTTKILLDVQAKNDAQAVDMIARLGDSGSASLYLFPGDGDFQCLGSLEAKTGSAVLNDTYVVGSGASWGAHNVSSNGDIYVSGGNAGDTIIGEGAGGTYTNIKVTVKTRGTEVAHFTNNLLSVTGNITNSGDITSGGTVDATSFTSDGVTLNSYVVRTDNPSVVDWIQSDLTMDGTAYELSLATNSAGTAVVPTNAVAAHVRIWIKDTSINQQFNLYRIGDTNQIAKLWQVTQVANQGISTAGNIGLDADRKVEYISSAGVDVIQIVVMGWYLEH